MKDPNAKRHRGVELLHDPLRNKGTAFTLDERDALGLRGLLPPRVATPEQQVARVLDNFRKKPDDLEKYIFLTSLQDRNEGLFYRLIVDHIEEMMPIIYTPTVGEACQAYGHIFRKPRGLYVSADDRGRVREILGHWPEEDVRVIVVTDGERILGLGDLGANGMGIPVGKLSLYTACAGIPPSRCLPVTLDVGTENRDLLADELYIGLARRRLRGGDYEELVQEFVDAVQERFPRAVLQFEDFAHDNAFRLLEKYRDSVCAFNDDIQGTAAVVLAGLTSALRLTGGNLADQRVLFVGAGAAGIGMANLLVSALMEEGLDEQAARQRCWFVDSRGLVVRSRENLERHKIPYAHDHAAVAGLQDAVQAVRPSALIGATGRAGMFDGPILEDMARQNERPIVFALSNPTSKAECTAEEAYRRSEGRAVFASGSPFAPVTLRGRTHVPGQANNAYIFPGLGLGVVASCSRRVTNGMLLAAARTLAGQVSQDDLEVGRIFPALRDIRSVSLAIAREVTGLAFSSGLARETPPADLEEHIRSWVYEPGYSDCI